MPNYDEEVMGRSNTDIEVKLNLKDVAKHIDK